MKSSIHAYSAKLADNTEALALHLLGKPSSRDAKGWRYGSKGSLSISMSGPKRGKWTDFETGEHGDGLDLIKREGLARNAAEAMEWARGWLGDTSRQPLRPELNSEVSRQQEIEDAHASERRKRDRNREIWKTSRPIKGTLGEAYFRKARGIHLDEWPNDLRFIEAMPGSIADVAGAEQFPAIMAVMRNVMTGEAQAAHYTFLKPDGSSRLDLKRDGYAGRKFFGSVKDAAIMLTPSEEITTRLTLGEGIENALTAIYAGLGPAWAAGSAGAIGAFPVLNGIEVLEIFADHGEAGIGNARKCAARWKEAGAEARITLAMDKSCNDINDLVRPTRSEAA